MSHNARIFLPLAVLALLFIGLAFYLYNSSSTLDTTAYPNDATESENITNPNAESGLKAISKYNPNTQQIDVYLSPAGDSHNFNSMALSITYTGSDLTSTSAKPDLNEEFRNSPWSSPFSDVESESDGQIVLNLALLNSSPEPFTLDKEIKLASLSIKTASPEAITSTIDQTVSQLYNLDGIEYQFDSAGESISLVDDEQL